MSEQKTVSEAAVSSAALPADDNGGHGHFYWLWKNVVSGPKSFAKRHYVFFIMLAIFTALTLFASRGYFHYYIIVCRQYFGGFIVAVILAIALAWWFKKAKLRARAVTIMLILAALWPVYEYGRPVHDYFAMWLRYKSLNLQQIPDWPQTDHERIQPLNSVKTMASTKVTENGMPTEPHFVRIGNEFRFTLGREPIYLMRRIFGGIRNINDVPGTTPELEFTGEALVDVNFEVGRNLLFGRNAYTAVCRALGPWRYLNCEPDGVIYMKDDAGKWVQVVPLIHWKNWIFPWPEFGGVVVIDQSPNGILQTIRRTFVGCGHFIPPSKISQYPFLKGQNILSFRASRFMAQSFRFHKGFFAPLPWVHNDDTRIPDMAQDQNDQPFTTFVRMSEYGGRDDLHHFFSLEPYNIQLKGLCASLFMPADGEPIIYAVTDTENKQQLMGVTSVASMVMNIFKFFDSSHIPVENRAFCRIIDNNRYKFWVTTIVTKMEKEGKSFIGGNNPDITLTDAVTQRCFYMKPPDSSTWVDQLRAQMKLPVDSPLLPMPNGSTGPPTAPVASPSTVAPVK